MTTATASGTQQTSQTQSGAGEGANGQQAVEYKFSPLEGATPEFDADVTATAKALGWTQEQAAKFREHEFKLAQSDIAAAKEAQAQAEAKAKIEREQKDTQRRQEWEKANRDHKEFGGQKYAETTERINGLLAKFDKDQAFSKAHLKESAEILNEPTFRAFLANIAYAMSSGTFHEGANNTNSEPKSLQEALYGSKPKG